MAGFSDIFEKVGVKLEKALAEGVKKGTLSVRQQAGLEGRIGAVQKLGEGAENIEGKAGAVTSFATNRSPFSAVGGAISGVGDKMLQSGEPFTMAGGAAVKLAGMLVESVDKVRAWTASLHEANTQFAAWSGSMALVQAEQENRDAILNREKGDYRAESAQELAEARSRLDRQLAPIENFWSKFQNKLGAFVSDVEGGFFKPLTDLLEKFGVGEADQNQDLADWDLLEKSTRDAMATRPARFNQAGGGGGNF